MSSIKYIRLASDIHLDFDAEVWEELPKYHPDRLKRVPEIDYLWLPKPMPEDKQTVMLIPGDLWVDNRPFTRRFAGKEAWVERLSKQFHSCVLLLGNHDYWGGILNRAVQKAKDHIKAYGLTNVHLLENEQVVIDNVKFLGGTLWTDYDKSNPLIVMQAPNYMNDFKEIRYRVGPVEAGIVRKLWTQDIINAHKETRKYILEHARRDNPDQKVVVLSHHGPSFDSVAEEYRNATDWDSNFFYFSELGWDLCDEAVQVDLWVHGHTHRACDYMVDRTRVICNPRGYHGHEAAETTGFEETLRLEVAHLQTVEPPQDELPQAVPIIEED
jgi:predicted MPP superfamily phosphohydrolase